MSLPGRKAVPGLAWPGYLQPGIPPGLFNGTAVFSASPALTCSFLSARIVMAANTMFPANQSGTYGALEAETTVTVPGVIDGIYA